MNTLSTNEVQNFDFTSYWDNLKTKNIEGIFDMDWLYVKQQKLRNQGIMEPIIKRMWLIRNKLREKYNKEVDPITWLAWCYFDQWHSCNTISKMLAKMGIDYKIWSLSQFTLKQCNWKKRPHTYITSEGIETLRVLAITRERAINTLQK